MPDLDTAQTQQLAERRGTNSHVLLWIVGKNRTTGTPESIGVWTGDDHQFFDIGAESRLYYGAGNVIEVPPVKAGIGLAVRSHRIILPPMTDEVRQALLIYEPRQAKCEVHVQPFNIDGTSPLGARIRMIKGVLNKAPEDIGGKGAASRTALTIVSNARRLTFGVPLLRTNAELRRRNADDRGREYSDVAGEWVVPWGTL